MTIDDRIRDELRAENGRLPTLPGDVGEVMRRGRRRRAGRRVAMGVAAAVLIAVPAALIQRWEPRPVPVVTAPPVVTTVPATPTTPGPTTADPSTTVASPAPDPTIAAHEGSSIVVAGPDGITRFADGEETAHFEVGPTMVAMDDPDGGVVVQVGMSASSILRMAPGTSEMTELVAPAPGETLRLHDVAVIDGNATVVYTSRTASASPEDVEEELRLFDLSTGEERTVAVVGAYERSPMRVSFGGGRFLLSMTAEGITWFESIDLDGSSVELPERLRSEPVAGEEFLTWMGHGVVDSEWETVAHLQGSPRSEAPFQLVVVDVSTGEELRAVPVPGARHDTVTRLAWNGNTAVVSLADGPPAVVGPGGEVSTLGEGGTATLAP